MQILASACFVVGSVFLVISDPGSLGAWCYLLGSLLFLAQALRGRPSTDPPAFTAPDPPARR